MKIFSPTHFLRHVSKPALHGFTQAHPIFPRLTIDWECPENSLAENVHAAIEVLQTSLLTTDLPEKEKSAIINSGVKMYH